MTTQPLNVSATSAKLLMESPVFRRSYRRNGDGSYTFELSPAVYFPLMLAYAGSGLESIDAFVHLLYLDEVEIEGPRQ